MIASDPDVVEGFFKELSKELYSKLDGMSKSVDGRRTYGNFYDDKKMKSDYEGYKTTIKTLEDKANDYEDKLYRQYAAMEKTLAAMQSKSNALAGLMGGNS